MEHDNIFVFKDKVSSHHQRNDMTAQLLTLIFQTATSAKRPAEYIEHEESQVRRHSSVNPRAASMAVARYGDHMSVGGQGDNLEVKDEKDHREVV
jgi:hypothetical protein